MGIPLIKRGTRLEREYEVKDEHTAKFLGSGDVEVLSTPAMILFMENTARLSVEGGLPENLTTVGTRVDVKHLRPAPKGSIIRVMAELKEQDGRRLVFEVRAYWRDEMIGEGIHERYIVDRDKFLEKLKRKIGVG